MGKLIDLTGQKFGRLTVIGVFSKSKKIKWSCICECGKKKNVLAHKLRDGLIKSCGCYRLEKKEISGITQRGVIVAEYTCWKTIKNRCYNKNNGYYSDYGGRGIKVCERWLHSYKNFLEDMGKKPTPNHSIDRIDVNGNYDPANCRWSTPEVQSRNKRISKRNKTGIPGVSWRNESNKYRVVIGVNNKKIDLGFTKTLDEAKRIREEGELKYWGKSS